MFIFKESISINCFANITNVSLIIFKRRKMKLSWSRSEQIFMSMNTKKCQELGYQNIHKLIIIIIIIIKICSAHISTLLGAQGAETKKKHEYKQFAVIAKTKLCTEIHVQCNYKYTSSLKNCDIKWVSSSDLNRVVLWQGLSLVGRWFQSLWAATEKDLSPQVRFEIGSFRSDLLERKLRDGV